MGRPVSLHPRAAHLPEAEIVLVHFIGAAVDVDEQLGAPFGEMRGNEREPDESSQMGQAQLHAPELDRIGLRAGANRRFSSNVP